MIKPKAPDKNLELIHYLGDTIESVIDVLISDLRRRSYEEEGEQREETIGRLEALSEIAIELARKLGEE